MAASPLGEATVVNIHAEFTGKELSKSAIREIQDVTTAHIEQVIDCEHVDGAKVVHASSSTRGLFSLVNSTDLFELTKGQFQGGRSPTHRGKSEILDSGDPQKAPGTLGAVRGFGLGIVDF